jgi:hypothetical protein
MKRLYTTFLALFILSVFVHGQPTNDDCSAAIAIGEVTDMMFSNIDATTDGPYHLDSPCPGASEDGQDSIYNDMWYAFTPTFTGNAEWTLCNTADFDTKIGVYNAGATCPLADSDLLTCNEDGSNCDNGESAVIFPVVMGETYLLRLGGYGDTSPGLEGTGSFSVSQFISTVSNDFCSDAIVVELGSMQEFTTVGTITDGPDHPDDLACFGFGSITATNDIWYLYTPDFTGSVIWSTCSMITFDSRLVVYGPDVSCPVQTDDIYSCNDDGGGCDGYSSELFFNVEEGKTYTLRLGAYNCDSGTGSFELSNENPPTPPENDLCANALEIPLTTDIEEPIEIDGSTEDAQFDNSNFILPNCLGNSTGGEFADVFFSFNSGGFSSLELNVFSFTPNGQYFIDIFEDCATPVDTLAITSNCFYYDSEENPEFRDTALTFPNVATDYIIRVITRTTSDLPGDFIISLRGLETVSVEDEQYFGETSFTPNPLTGNSGFISTNLNRVSDVDLKITDLNGKVILTSLYPNQNSGNSKLKVDFPENTSGIYFVTLRSEGFIKTFRVVKI